MKTTPVELNNDRERMIYALAYKNGVAAMTNLLGYDGYMLTENVTNFIEQIEKLNSQWDVSK